MQVRRADGPVGPRRVLTRSSVEAQGLRFSFVSEEIAAPTDWSFTEPHHVVVVHQAGQLSSLECEVLDGPRTRSLPRVGDVWVIPAQHRYAALAKGTTVAFCEIAIPTTALPKPTLDPSFGKWDPFLTGLIARLPGLAQRTDPMSLLMRDSIAETVRLHIADRYCAEPTAPVRDRRGLTPADQQMLVEHLETHLDGEISLAAMAELVGMPVSSLMSGFKDAFGTTPHQFLIDRRINRAKSLLVNTTDSVTDISAAVGFSTPSHFATTFKQRVGVPPSAYRSR
jgi:AraC family transcriptional regulator